jgi:hypothetical protein
LSVFGLFLDLFLTCFLTVTKLMNETHTYNHPVSQLLKFKVGTNWNEDWIDYADKFGFTKADIPELLRFCTNQDWDDEFSGDYSIHGLRAATQLDPQIGLDAYINFLLEFPEDDYFREEVTGISKQVGEIAIAPMTELIDNHNDDPWLQILGASGLEGIGKKYPELRDRCVQILMDKLKNYCDRTDNILNSNLVTGLVELKAVEASDLIAEAFANTPIDEFVTGSWASVQVELGLKKESDFSAKELEPKMPDYILNLQKMRSFRKSDLAKGLLVGVTLPAKTIAKGFGGTVKAKKGKKKKD